MKKLFASKSGEGYSGCTGSGRSEGYGIQAAGSLSFCERSACGCGQFSGGICSAGGKCLCDTETGTVYQSQLCGDGIAGDHCRIGGGVGFCPAVMPERDCILCQIGVYSFLYKYKV